ncbi:MAG: Fur family transcriptional regulator [Nitrososphaerales archaeon]
MLTLKQIITMLHQKGHKVTPQRLAICEILFSYKSHPTADEIYKRVSQKFPTISLSTIYQTLNLLMKLGLIQELGFPNISSRYDANTSPHIHIICPKCGNTQDYEDKKFEELWSKFITKLNFKPIGQRLEIYKYCDKCSKIG